MPLFNSPKIIGSIATTAKKAKSGIEEHGELDEDHDRERCQVRFRPAYHPGQAGGVGETEGEGVTMESGRSRKTPSPNDAKSGDNHNTRLQG
jgi:hypothetical protein